MLTLVDDGVVEMPDTLPLRVIKIGDRFRKDMGDLDGLAASMHRHGLLHPVVITSDRTLVAGHRRIEAARLLQWTSIPVTVVDVEDLLSAECDENAARKNFLPTEFEAIGRLVEEHERPRAVERVRDNARRATAIRTGDGAVVSTPPSEKANVSDIAARAVGVGRTKYTQAKRVMAAAREDPDTFGHLPSRMDETGNVAGAFRELKKLQEPEADPPEPYVPETKRQRELAGGQKRRVVEGLSLINGVCRGLRSVDVDRAVSMFDDRQELEAFADMASKAAGVLRRLGTELRGHQDGS